MPVGAIGNVRDLIEIAISAAAVLGGSMAFISGREATGSVTDGDPPRVLADRVNQGLAQGFNYGLWSAGVISIVLVN
jgi:hypothetical protein